MSKLRKWLQQTVEKLKMRHAKLAIAQRRYTAFHKRAYKASKEFTKLQRKANKLRTEKRFRAEQRVTKQATRAHGRELKLRAKKQYWLGVIKVQQQNIHMLNNYKHEAEDAIEKWIIEHGIVVTDDGNHVKGGHPRERLRVAMHTAMSNCSHGKQNNYYSMYGAPPDTNHILRGYPDGHRWDCSTYADGLYICCGLTSPSGGSSVGWTGTEGEHGHKVAEDDAKTGDLVLYGPAPHHHVEVVLDPDRKVTSGHGSAPIDRGIYNLFGDYDYEIRRYIK